MLILLGIWIFQLRLAWLIRAPWKMMVHVIVWFGWNPSPHNAWKLNNGAARSCNCQMSGLSWVLPNHLGRTRLAEMKFISLMILD